ncbi:MAG: hypothetical protein ACUVTP_08160 [Candidatus Fervidibacter sp.]
MVQFLPLRFAPVCVTLLPTLSVIVVACGTETLKVTEAAVVDEPGRKI